MTPARKGVIPPTHPMSACIFDTLDTSLGTLWWVREKEWAEKIADYSSKRKSHPGLSINQAKARECPSYVLMLQGTSEQRGSSVVVRGLKRKEPARPTYFRRIAPIETCLFTAETTNRDPDDPDWTRHTAIVRNHDKPWITEDEQENLFRWQEAQSERQRKHHAP